MIDTKRVTEVKFEMVVDGKRRTAIFIRRAKIDEIMLAQDPIGEFLQAIAHDETPPSQAD